MDRLHLPVVLGLTSGRAFAESVGAFRDRPILADGVGMTRHRVDGDLLRVGGGKRAGDIARPVVGPPGMPEPAAGARADRGVA